MTEIGLHRLQRLTIWASIKRIIYLWLLLLVPFICCRVIVRIGSASHGRQRHTAGQNRIEKNISSFLWTNPWLLEVGVGGAVIVLSVKVSAEELAVIGWLGTLRNWPSEVLSTDVDRRLYMSSRRSSLEAFWSESVSTSPWFSSYNPNSLHMWTDISILRYALLSGTIFPRNSVQITFLQVWASYMSVLAAG